MQNEHDSDAALLHTVTVSMYIMIVRSEPTSPNLNVTRPDSDSDAARPQAGVLSRQPVSGLPQAPMAPGRESCIWELGPLG